MGLKQFILILGVVFLSGCGGFLGPVPESEWTKSTVFDGAWSGQLVMTHFQRHARYEYECSAFEAKISMDVAGPTAYGVVEFDDYKPWTFTAHLADDGYFYASVPTEWRYGGNETPAYINIVYAGRLDVTKAVGSGKMIYVAGEGDSGCTATFDVARKE